MKLFQRLKPFLFVLVLAFMAWGLWTLRQQLAEALINANWLYLLFAGILAAIYLVLNASVWSLALRMVGLNPSRKHSATLWIECEAMRWLPGGIWGYASRVVEAKRLGANKAKGGLSLAIELVLTVTAWGGLGIIGALLSPQLRSVAMSYLEKIPPLPIVSTSLVGMMFVVLVLVVLLRFRKHLLDATKDLRAELFAHWQLSVRALFEYTVLNLFYGLGFLFCMKGLNVEPLPSFFELSATYGLAWIAGFFAFGAPGGLGVREGFLYLAFLPLGIGAEVASAAIIWRAIQIVVELKLLVVIKAFGLSPAIIK